MAKPKPKAKRTAAEAAEYLGLREGNIMRSLSLNAENYNLLEDRVIELKRKLGRRVSISEVVDTLIAGYVKGKIKLQIE